jgi:hypothetical protein
MLSQTVLPFKLDSTQDTITAQAGLVWAGLEFSWTPLWAKVMPEGVSDGKEELCFHRD